MTIRGQRGVPGLQPGQRVAAPSDLLAVRERPEPHRQRRGATHRLTPGGTIRVANGSAKSGGAPPRNSVRGDRREVDDPRAEQDHGVPPGPGLPDQEAAEQGADSVAGLRDAGGDDAATTNPSRRGSAGPAGPATAQPCEAAAAHDRRPGTREHQDEPPRTGRRRTQPNMVGPSAARSSRTGPGWRGTDHRDTGRPRWRQNGCPGRPRRSGQATCARTLRLIRPSIAAMPRSRSGLTAWASPRRRRSRRGRRAPRRR